MTRLALLLAAPLLAAGCADTTPGLATAEPARDSYVISLAADAKTAPTTWRLTCVPSGGNHPDPAGACAAIEANPDPFGPVKPDTACTEIYGGPAVATITGYRDGARVDAKYTRTDGCQIARWDALAVVIPGPIPTPAS